MSSERELEITRIGSQGHGIAESPGGPLYVRYALPGERWRIDSAGRTEPVSLRADRAPPLCRHFGVCGGCVAQHMPAAEYDAWKQGTVAQAFAHRGIAAHIEPIRRVRPHSRRRAVLGVARRGGGTIEIGFREEGAHTLVDLSECPVLDREIEAALPVLRAIAGLALEEREGARLLVTRADNGLDVSLESGRPIQEPDRLAAAAALARTGSFARLMIAGRTLFLQSPPTVMLGSAGGRQGVPVELAAGAFLQAVPEAERTMVALAVEALRGSRTVADLFAGMGTFTLAIARRSPVLAVDAHRPSLEALQRAARRAPGLRPVTVRVRDLMREPLSRSELKEFDAVVLDPPRAGARAQAEALARSTVRRLVYVSCNPATLARDARILIDGGYRLGPVVPIDQFLFSPHVEAVATFSRE